MSDKRIVETTFPVRYAETDQMQMVHHASYVVWMEEGRSEFMRRSGADYADIERGGYYFAVTSIRVRFLASAHYGERVTVRTWIEELRSRQLTFGYEIVNAENELLLVAGQSEHVCINHAGQVTRIPEQWRQLLARSALPRQR
jgi:acyl-CoA thioester hydrolase